MPITFRHKFVRFLLDSYKKRKQDACDDGVENCLATVRAMLKKAKYAFLVTHGADGWCSTRLVQPISDFDGSLIWIGTNPALRKVREIQTDSKTTLAFDDAKEDASLVFYGETRVETDPSLRRRYWKEGWRLFFPKGPAGDDYTLLRMELKKIELMNFSRNVVPEPFGLRPAVLINKNGVWGVEAPMAQH
jgi:general stress protein 26